MPATVLWFRQDLRLADNPALRRALNSEQALICLYILPNDALGGAAKWWLHHSLQALNNSLKEHGNQLILRQGEPRAIFNELIQQYAVNQVYWNRRYEPAAIAHDKALKAELMASGIQVASCNSHLLFEPWTVTTQKGGFYQVFTPFWRKGCRAGFDLHYSLDNFKQTIPCLKPLPATDALASWHLLPTQPNWARSFTQWQPGEQGAQKRLSHFLQNGLAGYKVGRDFPMREKVSRLSPHLHWGEIAPWRVWDAVSHCSHVPVQDIEHFQNELGWREFSYYLLYHFPSLPSENFKAQFDHFPWQHSPKNLHAWQQGLTGYPLVDAGMRELWQTGWMHNRLRMIVASFLVKDLLLDWRRGAAWFLDTLLDADLANNSASWQWVAGSGVDAAPYFRIFNPLSQSEKFDEHGDYIRQWVPELARLPAPFIHQPDQAPAAILRKYAVELGKTYPFPIVNHNLARKHALAAYQQLTRK